MDRRLYLAYRNDSQPTVNFFIYRSGDREKNALFYTVIWDKKGDAIFLMCRPR